MSERRWQIVIRTPRAPAGPVLALEEVAVRTGLHPDTVRRFRRLGLIDPLAGDSMRYPGDVVARIERILRIRRDLGVGMSSMALVMDLLDRIDELEDSLRGLREELARRG